MDIIPFPMVLVEGTCDHSHGSGMLTSEDLRELAQRCLTLAKTCTNPSVAEQLLMLAANYLELAERALGLHQPPQRLDIAFVPKPKNKIQLRASHLLAGRLTPS
jgi:hypothetical protein